MQPVAPHGADSHGAKPQALCYSVPDAARLLGVDSMTLYRAINAGQFPAIKIRGRITVPYLVIARLIDAAVTSGALVDTAAWTAAQPNPLPVPPRPEGVAS